MELGSRGFILMSSKNNKFGLKKLFTSLAVGGSVGGLLYKKTKNPGTSAMAGFAVAFTTYRTMVLIDEEHSDKTHKSPSAPPPPKTNQQNKNKSLAEEIRDYVEDIVDKAYQKSNGRKNGDKKGPKGPK
jgi:hypothetical protein